MTAKQGRKKRDVSFWKKTAVKFKDLRFRNFIFLLLAGTVNAFGVTIFLFPVKLYDSGISGLSMLLDQVTPPTLTLSVFLMLLNFPIFCLGAKKQGRNVYCAPHVLFTRWEPAECWPGAFSV